MEIPDSDYPEISTGSFFVERSFQSRVFDPPHDLPDRAASKSPLAIKHGDKNPLMNALD
jgi:hypothetical protein